MKLFLPLIVIATIVFALAVAFDLSPYLRGPAPYYPDWRWDYNFVNTYHKLWFPIIISILIIYLFYSAEKKGKKWTEESEKKFLFGISFFGFLFQFALLFANRAGINSLLNRIINPDVNGYFSSALPIADIPVFFRTFNDSVLSLLMHAQGHPPFSILFFWVINRLFSLVPLEFPLKNLKINTPLVKETWLSLPQEAQLGALFSAILIPFLVVATGVALYFVSKKLYGVKSAVRTLTLYFFIPNILLFIPINDVFIAIFPLFSLLLLLKAIEKKNILKSFIAGFVFSIGFYFSISLLPILFIILLVSLQKIKFKVSAFQPLIFTYILGFLSIPAVLFFQFGFDTFRMVQVLVSGLPEERKYSTWAIYNLYDFFIFTGLPLAMIYFLILFRQVKAIIKKDFKRVEVGLIAFTVMLILLNFSGSVRGETGRIWIPYVPFLLLPVVYLLTNQKLFNLSTKQFGVVILSQLIVVIALNLYWVALW